MGRRGEAPMKLPADFDRELWLDPLAFKGLVGRVLASDKAEYASLFRDDGFAKPIADLLNDQRVASLMEGKVAIRFCKDCAHFWPPPWLAGSEPECRRPLWAERIDLVTGEPKRLGANPKRERSSEQTLFGRERCGPKARFFEQRPEPWPPIEGAGAVPPPHKG